MYNYMFSVSSVCIAFLFTVVSSRYKHAVVLVACLSMYRCALTLFRHQQLQILILRRAYDLLTLPVVNEMIAVKWEQFGKYVDLVHRVLLLIVFH